MTRVSPFRVSTLVSLAPVGLVEDFGVMARQEGDPVPHEHQFYRATLQGLISLDLRSAGTFSYKDRTGYLNLDEPRLEEAKKAKLKHLKEEKAFRLPAEERIGRVAALLEGLAQLDGGAKQAIHYTDVSPDLVLLAVTRGGNNIFGHVAGADGVQRPVVKIAALREALGVFADDLLSDVYVGWTEGFLDEQRAGLRAALESGGELASWSGRVRVDHPRAVFQALVKDLKQHGTTWMA